MSDVDPSTTRHAYLGLALEAADRFTGLAAAYDRFRPRYPARAIEALLAGLEPEADVVDVGAGTGISSRALMRSGARVIAIEPNDEMRAIAASRGVDVRPGRANATGLPSTTADLVTAFQAFHWFTNRNALDEFARLLRSTGRVGLVWNERDTKNDAFTREVRAIEQRYPGDSPIVGSNFHNDALVDLLNDAGFSRVRVLQFPNDQRLDRIGLIGRVRSTSYAPRGGPNLDATIRELDALIERFADNSGHVTMHYRTDVIIGER